MRLDPGLNAASLDGPASPTKHTGQWWGRSRGRGKAGGKEEGKEGGREGGRHLGLLELPFS